MDERCWRYLRHEPFPARGALGCACLLARLHFAFSPLPDIILLVAPSL